MYNAGGSFTFKLCYHFSAIHGSFIYWLMVSLTNNSTERNHKRNKLQHENSSAYRHINMLLVDICLMDAKAYHKNEFCIDLLTYSCVLYARLKNGRIMPWQCPSVRLSVRPFVRPRFPDFSWTCFDISIWNLVYTFSRWHDISSLSCITIGSLWPSLQPKVGQTHFLQSWPHKSR